MRSLNTKPRMREAARQTKLPAFHRENVLKLDSAAGVVQFCPKRGVETRQQRSKRCKRSFAISGIEIYAAKLDTATAIGAGVAERRPTTRCCPQVGLGQRRVDRVFEQRASIHLLDVTGDLDVDEILDVE